MIRETNPTAVKKIDDQNTKMTNSFVKLRDKYIS